jgi:hypothetical protein
MGLREWDNSDWHAGEKGTIAIKDEAYRGLHDGFANETK